MPIHTKLATGGGTPAVTDPTRSDAPTTRVVIATKGVRDLDGDVTLDGWLQQQEALVVGAHDWSRVPLGRARTRETDSEILAEIAWFTHPEAKAWATAIAEDFATGNPRFNYSYGFSIKPGATSRGKWGNADVQFLGPLADGSPGAVLIEVSPCLVGAGHATRTLDTAAPSATPTAAESDLTDLVAREYARFIAGAQLESTA